MLVPIPLRFVVAALLLTFSTALEATAQKAIILVRHAERLDQTADSGLSPAGIERARTLARQLRDLGIRAIYTTELQRTVKTAEPLAELLKIKSTVVPAANVDDLVQRIKRDHAGDVVLIVGHSNTVPLLIKAFGAVESITIPDSDYDNLFIVLPQVGRPALLLRLRY
jgi:2,3-bisphosphoglycerate-dependent phosphoglycerate mutase